MPLVPVTHQSWLFSPPLELPLQPRLENGRFDSLRRRPLAGVPECNSTQVILAGDPANPTDRDVYFFNRLHQAVDLASEAGNCVYAAYSGRIVKVEVQPGGDTANVSIDHHPRGLGFVTNYNHITEVQVAEGDFVGAGEPFAQVSGVPDDPTLTSSSGRSSIARIPAMIRQATATWCRSTRLGRSTRGSAARRRRAGPRPADSARRRGDASQHRPLLLRAVRGGDHAARAHVRADDRRRAAHRRVATRGTRSRRRSGCPSATRRSGESTWRPRPAA